MRHNGAYSDANAAAGSLRNISRRYLGDLIQRPRPGDEISQDITVSGVVRHVFDTAGRLPADQEPPQHQADRISAFSDDDDMLEKLNEITGETLTKDGLARLTAEFKEFSNGFAQQAGIRRLT